MKLELADLPLAVQKAFRASAIRPEETAGLGEMGARTVIEPVAIIDHSDGMAYTTCDGQSFEVEPASEHSKSGHISTRRVIRILRR